MNATMLLLKLLDTALMVGEFSIADRASLEETAANLRNMIREGRDPTDAEWSQANTASDEMLANLADRAAKT